MISIILCIATLTFVLHILIILDSIVLEPLLSILSWSKVTDVEGYKKCIVFVSLGTLFLDKVNLKTKTTPWSVLEENSFKLSTWIRKDILREGYFEEALKIRNTLQEFAKKEGPLPTTILDLREHIFTGRVSSLANYMVLHETLFVTLG